MPFLAIFIAITLSGCHQTTRAAKTFYGDFIDHFKVSNPVFVGASDVDGDWHDYDFTTSSTFLGHNSIA